MMVLLGKQVVLSIVAFAGKVTLFIISAFLKSLNVKRYDKQKVLFREI